MSESDEFGGFEATTPIVSRTIPNSGAAGPSRVVNKGKANKVPVSVDSDDDDVQEVSKVNRGPPAKRRRKKVEGANGVESEHESKSTRNRLEEDDGDSGHAEEVQEVHAPATTKKVRGSSRRPVSFSGNGETSVNGTTRTTRKKVKNKAKVPSVMDVDEVESLDNEEADARMEVEKLASVINHSFAPSKQAPRVDDRLREQLKLAQGHIEDLKQQLEELHQVRMTEPEVLLERIETQNRKAQQSSESLIKDLREQLAKRDPLLRTNKSTAFELLTREEANKEAQALRDQVKTYQDAIRDRDQIVKERDDEITTLKTSLNDVRYELQAEIERSKTLITQKQPDSVRKGRMTSQNEDPKMGALVRFYEDLTNLLVTDIKPQPARYLQFQDWSMTCMYTYRDLVNNTSSSVKSLSFKLRQCFEPKPDLEGEPKKKEDLVQSLQYTPLHLEKEAQEYVTSLGFLNKPFSFEQEQLALFLRTLHDVVGGENGDDSNGSDNGIQLLA